MQKLPQPNAESLANLKKIAAQTGKRLQQIPIEEIMGFIMSYSCDEAGNVTVLNLAIAGIADISFLTDFPRLTHLILYKNQISDLAPLMALTKLTTLNLWANQTADLSPLQALTQLKELVLENNQITDLSPLQALTQLTYLNLSNNQVADLSPLKALTQLNVLWLNDNKIADISPLMALTQLNNLDLRYNQVADLSPIKALIQLTYLFLSENKVADLSPLKALTHLTVLTLRKNRIVDLSPIRALIEKMEVKWEYESEEKGIFLEGNPLEIPPVEIVKQGKEAVLAYFASLEKDERAPLNEVKVLLVGDGGAGKTSLIKQLKGMPFDKNESATHGVNIVVMDIKTTLPDGKKEIIKTHFWDFGGQEIMHASHQFFLSKRSLYILLLDGRKDEKTEYWLKHIESFGGNSPVLVVINKIDVNRAYDADRQTLLEKYKNIKGFYRISCRTGEGINEFKQALEKEIPGIELLKTPLSKSWLAVKEKLESATAARHYIDDKEFNKICAAHHIEDETARETLVEFLNELGIVLHFKKLALTGFYMLNPRWVTEAVYKIINSPYLAENKGILPEEKLDFVLNKETKKKNPLDLSLKNITYTGAEAAYILSLMQEFELCYSLGRGRVLIPDLLPTHAPKYSLPEEKSLDFQVCYDFLPKSVMARFIVKSHHDIKGTLRWRTGVVLESRDYKTTASVRADEVDKTIYIRVTGERRRDHLSVIRHTLREINDSFENLQTAELVSLPDNPEITVEYEELTGYEASGKPEIFIGKLRKGYSVSLLLDGIEEPGERISEYTKISREGGGDIYINFDQEIIQQNKQEQKVTQVTAVKQETNIAIDIDIKLDLPALKHDFFKLKDELAELAKKDPHLAEELKDITNHLDELSLKTKKKELTNPLNKMGRFLEKLGDKDSRLSKILAGTKKGIESAQKLGRTYNKFAQWLALPQLPDVIVGKK